MQYCSFMFFIPVHISIAAAAAAAICVKIKSNSIEFTAHSTVCVFNLLQTRKNTNARTKTHTQHWNYDRAVNKRQTHNSIGKVFERKWNKY